VKKRAKKDQVAGIVCYLVAIGAAAMGWVALAAVAIFLAVMVDPPVRRR
jgi:hypothetical protein